MTNANKCLTALAATAGAYAAYRTAICVIRRFSFRDRTVVITGGSRGLGLVMARQLADEGARIAICSRHSDEVSRAVTELRRRHAQVIGASCDVTDPKELELFFADVLREFGPVDVLINNAGVIQVGPLEAMTNDDFDQAMEIHFKAPLAAIQHVLPHMRRAGDGRIVNIASVGGEIAVPHMAPYCASKFALVGLSQAMRAELAHQGVYVTTVCPGLLRTGSHRRAWFKGRHQAEYAWFSLGASSPFPAISAESAARQIIRACRYGRAHVTLSLPAKLAACVSALAPELTADVTAALAHYLPPADGEMDAVEGRRLAASAEPSVATMLGERAAARNNELVPGRD
jgi:NAD(P)-dependent dehydrogenase (short-subunit alcohol dehydrogenase family)